VGNRKESLSFLFPSPIQSLLSFSHANALPIAWFRLFVGDLSNDVNDNTLNAAFAKYPSYIKCKVVRDRLSDKAKYGFIAFTDPEDFLKAWKEMDGRSFLFPRKPNPSNPKLKHEIRTQKLIPSPVGKYVGNRPIRLMKVNEKQHGGIRKVNIGHRKAKELDKLAKNKGKPLDGRPTPW
jgi:RNA recognition motif-containing protein